MFKTEIKILILEDESIATIRLKQLITNILPFSLITEADSVEQGISLLQNGYIPNLAFFDIQLGDGLSFEILETIPCYFPIIFTTAFDEYAIKAFKFNSVDYLLKPIGEEKLKQSLEKYERIFSKIDPNTSSLDFPSQRIAIDQILEMLPIKKKFRERFLVKSGDKYFPVPIQEIAFFKTEDKAVYLYKNQGNIRHLMDYNLDEIEKMLDPNSFFRLNRQMISCSDSIRKMSNLINGKLKVEVEPSQKEEIIVSREKAQEFKDWMGR